MPKVVPNQGRGRKPQKIKLKEPMADYEKRMRKKTIGRGFKGEKESFTERMKRLSKYITKDKRAKEAKAKAVEAEAKVKKATQKKANSRKERLNRSVTKLTKSERFTSPKPKPADTRNIGKAMDKFSKAERYQKIMKRVGKTARKVGLSAKRGARTKPGRIGGVAAVALPLVAEGVKYGVKRLQKRQADKKLKRQDERLMKKYKKKDPKKQKRFEKLMSRKTKVKYK